MHSSLRLESRLYQTINQPKKWMNGSWDKYLAYPADFAGVDNIITNLAKEWEPGIGIIECTPLPLIITSLFSITVITEGLGAVSGYTEKSFLGTQRSGYTYFLAHYLNSNQRAKSITKASVVPHCYFFILLDNKKQCQLDNYFCLIFLKNQA